MPTATSTARLEVRISANLIRCSIVVAVQEAAQRAIERAEVVRLSLADQECFAQALLSPPQPALALERAFARRSKLLRTE